MSSAIKKFFFENQSTRQTVAKNTLWLGIGTVLSRLIRATLIIYAGRVLGTAGYGIFSYALSLAAFFTIFSDMGISALTTRQIVQKPKDIDKYISTSFVIKVGILLLTILATIFISPHFTKIEAVSPLIPYVAILLAFDSLRGFGFSITRAYNKMEIESILNFLTNALITALGFVVLIIAPTPKNLAMGYALASALGTLSILLFIGKNISKIKFNFDTSLIKQIFKSALPFALMGVLGAFMINIDTIIIGAFKTASDLGLYGAAQRAVQFIYMLPGFIAISMFPLISKLIKDGKIEKMKSLFNSLIRFAFVFAIPITIGGIIVSKDLIVLLFGGEYAQSAITFAVLLLTVLITAPSSLITNTLFALDKQRIFVISSTIGALANTVLDFVFIPKYGIVGSAIVTVIAMTLVTYRNWFELKKDVIGLSIPSLNKPIFATIIMTLVVLFMHLSNIHVVVTILAAGIIYIGILLVLKDPSIKELKTLIAKK